jgi:uncharacterized protein with HEPN domain
MSARLPDHARILHALEAIQDVRSYLEGIQKDALIEDKMRFHAVLHQLAVLGEACNRISPETKSMAPELPWKSASALRNLIVHEYFGVDDFTIWDTVKNDLPDFEKALIALLDALKP